MEFTPIEITSDIQTEATLAMRQSLELPWYKEMDIKDWVNDDHGNGQCIHFPCGILRVVNRGRGWLIILNNHILNNDYPIPELEAAKDEAISCLFDFHEKLTKKLEVIYG